MSEYNLLILAPNRSNQITILHKFLSMPFIPLRRDEWHTFTNLES
jgi:hypothetical protein